MDLYVTIFTKTPLHLVIGYGCLLKQHLLYLLQKLFVVISHLDASASVDCLATACWAEERQARAKDVEQEHKSCWRKFCNSLKDYFYQCFALHAL